MTCISSYPSTELGSGNDSNSDTNSTLQPQLHNISRQEKHTTSANVSIREDLELSRRQNRTLMNGIAERDEIISALTMQINNQERDIALAMQREQQLNKILSDERDRGNDIAPFVSKQSQTTLTDEAYTRNDERSAESWVTPVASSCVSVAVSATIRTCDTATQTDVQGSKLDATSSEISSSLWSELEHRSAAMMVEVEGLAREGKQRAAYLESVAAKRQLRINELMSYVTHLEETVNALSGGSDTTNELIRIQGQMARAATAAERHQKKSNVSFQSVSLQGEDSAFEQDNCFDLNAFELAMQKYKSLLLKLTQNQETQSKVSQKVMLNLVRHLARIVVDGSGCIKYIRSLRGINARLERTSTRLCQNWFHAEAYCSREVVANLMVSQDQIFAAEQNTAAAKVATKKLQATIESVKLQKGKAEAALEEAKAQISAMKIDAASQIELLQECKINQVVKIGALEKELQNVRSAHEAENKKVKILVQSVHSLKGKSEDLSALPGPRREYICNLRQHLAVATHKLTNNCGQMLSLREKLEATTISLRDSVARIAHLEQALTKQKDICKDFEDENNRLRNKKINETGDTIIGSSTQVTIASLRAENNILEARLSAAQHSAKGVYGGHSENLKSIINPLWTPSRRNLAPQTVSALGKDTPETDFQETLREILSKLRTSQQAHHVIISELLDYSFRLNSRLCEESKMRSQFDHLDRSGPSWDHMSKFLTLLRKLLTDFLVREARKESIGRRRDYDWLMKMQQSNEFWGNEVKILSNALIKSNKVQSKVMAELQRRRANDIKSKQRECTLTQEISKLKSNFSTDIESARNAMRKQVIEQYGKGWKRDIAAEIRRCIRHQDPELVDPSLDISTSTTILKSELDALCMKLAASLVAQKELCRNCPQSFISAEDCVNVQTRPDTPKDWTESLKFNQEPPETALKSAKLLKEVSHLRGIVHVQEIENQSLIKRCEAAENSENEARSIAASLREHLASNVIKILTLSADQIEKKNQSVQVCIKPKCSEGDEIDKSPPKYLNASSTVINPTQEDSLASSINFKSSDSRLISLDDKMTRDYLRRLFSLPSMELTATKALVDICMSMNDVVSSTTSAKSLTTLCDFLVSGCSIFYNKDYEAACWEILQTVFDNHTRTESVPGGGNIKWVNIRQRDARKIFSCLLMTLGYIPDIQSRHSDECKNLSQNIPNSSYICRL